MIVSVTAYKNKTDAEKNYHAHCFDFRVPEKIFEVVKKVMHPHMVTNIRVNKVAVPKKIVGRILGFFFLSVLTLFISSAIFSFSGTTFSEGVAMSVACLTNVGVLPGICEPSNFVNLSAGGKIFCMIILIVGRLEIFALLIFLASVQFNHTAKSKW